MIEGFAERVTESAPFIEPLGTLERGRAVSVLVFGRRPVNIILII
jgi:hypothetical protein